MQKKHSYVNLCCAKRVGAVNCLVKYSILTSKTLSVVTGLGYI
jgi:hypothetical protein